MSDILERLALPCNPVAPDADVTLQGWVLDLICDARDEIIRRRERVAELEGALELYRDAVRIDVLMEGPRFAGSNVSALKRAWEHDRAVLTAEKGGE